MLILKLSEKPMKLPLSLIKNFITINHSIEEISAAITKSGIEVDGIENATCPFSNIVCGKILSKEKHPDADKLSLLKVFDGKSELQIVCGASNCREGMQVALAKIGAFLTDDKGKKWEIKESKIRGVKSFGMLCSEKELQLTSENDGIMELPESIEVGKDLIPYLWDPVFELSLTPNLGHCFSALGVARELSCFLNTPLKKVDSSFTPGAIDTAEKLKAEISSKNCSRYTVCYLENINVEPSPFWLKLLLEKSGLRSVNNIVDITNLVMLELGQPLHAFDYDLLEGQSLSVQDLKEKQEFVGLDDVKRTVLENTLVICDGEKPVAIGGIIGGNNSAITENTKNIVLEAATFDSTSIRKSAKALGLRTDSAQRFERKTDFFLTQIALDRACHYLQKYFGATVSKESVDTIKTPYKEKTIELRVSRVSLLLGYHLSQSEIEEVFTKLSLPFTAKEEIITVNVPSYRQDLSIEEDLIEEVARVFGYDHLKGKKPRYTTTKIPHDPLYLFEKKLRKLLIAQGLSEWLTCDLISPKLKDLVHEQSIGDASIVEVMHAKSIDYSILRPSLLPGMLQSLKQNFSFQNKDIAAFEIGKVHLKDGDKYLEPTLFSVLLTGSSPGSWDKKEESKDFYDLKGVLENIFTSLDVPPSFTPSSHPSFHPYRQAHVHIDGVYIGVLGELNQSLSKKMGIKKRVFFAELQCEYLLKKQSTQKRFTKLPTQPASERDVTLSVNRRMPVADILKKYQKNKPAILEKVFLIDLFEDEKIGLENKNVTIRFIYRDPIRTLSFEEIEEVHQKLISTISF